MGCLSRSCRIFPAGPVVLSAGLQALLEDWKVVLRTIERNRIWSWPQAIESVMSIRISLEFAPKIVLDLILVLLFIQAIG
jgi:hypothetical protein